MVSAIASYSFSVYVYAFGVGLCFCLSEDYQSLSLLHLRVSLSLLSVFCLSVFSFYYVLNGKNVSLSLSIIALLCLSIFHFHNFLFFPFPFLTLFFHHQSLSFSLCFSLAKSANPLITFFHLSATFFPSLSFFLDLSSLPLHGLPLLYCFSSRTLCVYPPSHRRN